MSLLNRVFSLKPKASYDQPSLAFWLDARNETKYTPDVGKLEQKTHHLLFAYDSFKAGKDCGVYVFTQDRFQMWRKDLGKSIINHFIPIKVPENFKDLVDRPVWADPNPLGGRMALASRVRGTLNLVEPGDIISLDKDMLNTVSFDRVRVPLYYPYQTIIRFKKHNPQKNNVVGTVWAWMYVARSEYWEPMIDNPDSLGLFRAAKITRPKSLWIGDFYTNEM